MSFPIATESRRLAHRDASRSSVADIAAYLQAVLGPTLAAVALGIKDVKAIGQWAKAQRQPRPAQEKALRETYQVVNYLATVEQPDVIRAWFMGMNPDLDDRSPALTMRTDPVAVLRAADAFVRNG
jgi:hypothetical protein